MNVILELKPPGWESNVSIFRIRPRDRRDVCDVKQLLFPPLIVINNL